MKKSSLNVVGAALAVGVHGLLGGPMSSAPKRPTGARRPDDEMSPPRTV